MAEKSFSEWLLSHRRSILFLLTVLVIAGIYSSLQMPVSLFPSLAFPRIVVSVNAGDRPAQQMALEVTRPVEQALRGVPNIQSISSSTSRGETDIDLRFSWGTNMPQAELQVQSALNQILPNLPAMTRFTVHREDPTKFPVIAYSLTSKKYTLVQLRQLAEYKLRPLLDSIAGVRTIHILGGAIPEYRVTVDPVRLAALGLSIRDVERALSAANVLQTVGKLQRHSQMDLLLANARFKNLKQIRATVLRTGKDGVIRLDDVATVKPSIRPQWMTVTANGHQAVLLMVHQQLGGNTVAIDHAIRKTLKENSKLIPPGVQIRKWYDQSTLILNSAGSVRDAMILGVIFAVIILFVFLKNWKITLIALLVVPSVLAASAVLLHAAGMSFNIMTLGGMAAAVGLIIDDVIVMVEHLIRHIQENGHQPGSILQATRKFTRPLAGSSIGTIIIFAPLAFLSGVTGAFFKALSLTVALSLLISFFFSWLAVPLIANHLLNAKDAIHEKNNILTRWGEHGYRSLMNQMLRHPLWLLVGLIPLILVGLYTYNHVPSGFMPAMNEGGFVLDYQTPPGTSLKESDRLLHQVAQILHKTPDVETWTRRTGAQLGGGITETNQGDFFILLHSARQQQAVMNHIAQQIKKLVPGVTVQDMNQPMSDLIGDLTGSPRPIVIRLFSDHWPQLVRLAPQVAKAITPLTGLKEIQDGLVVAGNSIDIRINRIKAALEGLDPQRVTQQLQSFLSGVVTTHIQQGQNIIGVRVWIPGHLRDKLHQIKKLLLRTPDGQMVPVGRIATFKEVKGIPQITRYDLKPEVAISARIQGMGFGQAIREIRRVLNTKNLLPKGVYYRLAGLYKQQQIAFHGMLLVFLTAVLLLFLLLLFLYERFSVALTILSMPLLSITAVFTGLWISKQTLNITALMGMTMILGIVTEIAVFYFYEYDRQCQNGQTTITALVEAGIHRLRPTLMTSIAAILALLPLGLGIGQGSAMQQPLAIAIISGLIVAMPLVLIAMPVIFLWFNKLIKLLHA